MTRESYLTHSYKRDVPATTTATIVVQRNMHVPFIQCEIKSNPIPTSHQQSLHWESIFTYYLI